MDGLIRHHIHKRRQQESQSSIAAPTSWMRFLEKSAIAAGVIGPLMVIPQMYKIYAFHSAAGVSAVSWFAFGILDIPFLVYGAAHKDKPIIITYTLWLIANFIVAIGAIAYS